MIATRPWHSSYWLRDAVAEKIANSAAGKMFAYWRTKLVDALPLKLPADLSMQTQADCDILHHDLRLSEDLSMALKALANRENCTLYLVLIVTFKLLLHRHYAQEVIVAFAQQTGQRKHAGLTDYFVDRRVLHTDFSGDPGFSELLARVRELAPDAYPYSILPLDKVENLRPERKTGLNPCVEVRVNFGVEFRHELKGVAKSLLKGMERQSALTLGLTGYLNSISLDLSYQATLFSSCQIDNLLEQFHYLLEQLSSTAQHPISAYSLLTPAARKRLPDPALPMAEPLVELLSDRVLACARLTPQQIAICQGKQAWSYATLSACSQTQARQLRRLGVQNGDVVALSGARSFGMVSAMLAIFLSGGVMLALDRNLPVARQQLMRHEANAKFMVRIAYGLEDIASLEPVSQLIVEAQTGLVLNQMLAPDNVGMPLPAPVPDDPAYVFFTSGSTGKPKGVLGTHKGMAHMIGWQRSAFSLTAEDRCAQLIHLSFDVVLRDIFLPLTSGATLCLPEAEDDASLLSWLCRERITHLHAVPSLAQSWLAEPTPKLPELRWIFFSGEPLHGILLRQWQERAPACKFANLYGPTETTLVKSFYLVPDEVFPEIQPLGNPLPDTQILVLNRQGERCGPGEPGELVIRTPFSTLGYLNDTDQRGFVQNPFRNDKQELIYRTGDLGYHAADGLLYILGRLDHQLKIHGVRIAPEEVRAVLAQYQGLTSCAVLGKKDSQGKDMLVAYVVAQHGATIAREARTYLAQRLPSAMVPAVWIVLAQLPLKANGKIDHDRLPEWDGTYVQPEQPFAALPIMELPTDQLRRVVPSYRGAHLTFSLPAEQAGALRQFSQQQGATLFMTLLAAFQVLLQRYTHQEDIVVGTPVAGRSQLEIEGLIGFFVNTLVLRADLSGNPSFVELLGRTRERALEAFTHQDLPFEKLVSELAPERHLSHNPLFQIMFILQNTPDAKLDMGGLEISQIPLQANTAKFDLTLSLNETLEKIDCQIEYSTDLYAAPTIARMALHYQTLLEGILVNPHARISALPLLTTAELQRLLVGWNDTAKEYPRERCVHQLFEAQVSSTPDAIALIYEDQRLDYAELNAKANQLAHYLRGMGVAANSRIAIALARSPAMIVAILATLKAGCAYVPLDPDYPAERLAFMLQDSGARILITQESLQAKLSGTALPTLLLEAASAILAQQPDGNSHANVSKEQLAYILYTSGSTGKPKGVAVQHASLLNFLHAMQSTPGFSAQDKLLSVTTVSFDIFGLEIYLPLISGGRMVLASTSALRDPALLNGLLLEHDITVLQATPSTWHTLIDTGWPGKSNLKMLVGGEALTGQLAKQMLPRGSSLWNLYGPTETTIWSSIHRVENVQGAVVSIGRPINNTQLYILDRHGQLTPIGISGELLIGGEGLARGYHERPELTAEKFIPNPFSDKPGSRLYKTGDLVRYAADGNIEFLGRIDNQVKVRGFRIELGEIEAALLQHPDVLNAVAQLRDTKSGGKMLVALILTGMAHCHP